MHRSYVLVGIVAVGIMALVFGYNFFRYKKSPVACTMEAKFCPDGSYVGRTGPHCEFSVCPTSTTTNVSGVTTHVTDSLTSKNVGVVTGHITISPTCPVERIPPDPHCAPQPFSTIISVSGQHNFFVEVHTDTAGRFYIPLPADEYKITNYSTTLWPACPTESVTINPGATTTVNIVCDSGIR